MNVFIFFLLLLNTNKEVINKYKTLDEFVINLIKDCNDCKKCSNCKYSIKNYEKSKIILKNIFNNNIKFKPQEGSYYKNYDEFLMGYCTRVKPVDELFEYKKPECNEIEYKKFIKEYEIINKYKKNNEKLKTSEIAYSVFEVENEIDSIKSKVKVEIFINAKTNKLLFYYIESIID